MAPTIRSARYTSGTNKLDHITDSVPSSNYTTDIDGQSSGNYKYDSIGELISDAASNISNITWTVYGKIASITKSGDTTLLFTYDPSGNRISKSVVHAGDTLTTWYVRDVSGNVMSVYTYGDPAVNGKDLTQTELHVYGSSRLGIWNRSVNVEVLPPVPSSSIPLLGTGDSLIFTRGNKLFELSNHLGNVLATISDKRYGVSPNGSTVSYFNPEVVSANDYYPFGSLQPGRSYVESNAGNYRYGFNGQEKDDEIKGAGNSYTAEFWEYDPRIGRRWNLDPKPAVGISQYSAFSNNPIWLSDPLGDTLSNPQLVSALKIGYDVVKSHVDNKSFNIGTDYSAEVNKAVLSYEEKNQLNFGDFTDFQQQSLDYYKGFKEVAGSVNGGATLADYGSKILGLASNRNNVTVIQVTQQLINSKNGEYGTVLQQAVRVFPYIMSMAETNVGPGPRGSSQDGLEDNVVPKYDPRVRARGVEDPTSHNFPYSFDKSILQTKPILQNNGYRLYRMEGEMMGSVKYDPAGLPVQTWKKGVFEIGVTKEGVINHRFFRPY